MTTQELNALAAGIEADKTCAAIDNIEVQAGVETQISEGRGLSSLPSGESDHAVTLGSGPSEAPPSQASVETATPASKKEIVTCCVTGAIPGDGGACGDCDPCSMGELLVPDAVKRLIAEKNSLIQRIGELETATPAQEVVAWRYKLHDGSIQLALTRLTDEQKARGYYTGVDGEDEVDGDEPIIGPFHWAEETPLYAHPAPAPSGTEALRTALERVMAQTESDLASAHAEICKLQNLDPAQHSWPEWSPQANTLRWFKVLRNEYLSTPAPAQQAVDVEAKDAEIARLRNGCAFGGNACERLTGMAWAHTKSEAELRDALDRIAELERQLVEKNGGRDAG